MSQRTIVEFNHDFGEAINRDPDAFLVWVRNMINSGSEGRGVKDALSRFGVTVTPTTHHSEDRIVRIGDYFEKKF